MSAAVKRLWAPLAAALALAYLVAMLVTGALPERRTFVKSEAHGVLELQPESVTRVTVSANGATAAFARAVEGWVREGSAAALEAPLPDTLDRAVKFMHTANPVRVLAPEEIAATGPAEYGLDRPPFSITLETADGVVLEADFGNKSSDGLLRYMRLRGGDEVYLMSGFVGKEWQAVVDAAIR